MTLPSIGDRDLTFRVNVMSMSSRVEGS